MKKILLATTLLAGSTTVAMAEAHMTWGASAAAGLASTAGGDFSLYSGVSLSFDATGATDGGLEFGVSTGLSAGTSFDSAGDFESGSAIGTDGGTLDAPEIYISGSFGKLAFKKDGYGFFHNDDDGVDLADVKYTNTFGGLGVGVIANVDAAAGNQYSFNLGYTLGGVKLNANIDGTEANVYDVSAEYVIGSITLKAGINDEQISNVKASYAAGSLSGYVKFDSEDDGDQMEIGGGYSANGLGVNFMATEGGYTEVTATYSLGGGLTVEGGGNSDNDAFIGARMEF